ncbi:Galactose-3-O-sulfotransferase 3 [Thelohanellus kitauei]|uniref:Galactose-3-O-sulfotransferase 3 n=1 Tax=Thelohanellus kitauei TaxID=669202 RepID=A0A0C2MM55_THEKT|nr:Galactose-3-O-sulfotransferase 3 [Thelohanellus kitauei]
MNIIFNPETKEIPRFCDKKKIVFIKTHKTGGSTIFNILTRLAKRKNMNVACFQHFIWPARFKSYNLLNYSSQPIHLLSSHVRYSKRDMQEYFPREETFYFTILRDSFPQWLSSFAYYKFYEKMGLHTPKEIEKFIKRLGKRFPDHSIGNKDHNYYLLKNPNLFDLGLDHFYHDKARVVAQYVEDLRNDFDLVMFMEDFNSSLLILKEMLCLTDDDILYLKMNELPENEKNRFNIKILADLRDSIYNLNKADMFLYDYFSKIFKTYAQIMSSKLAMYQKRLDDIYEVCIGQRLMKIAYGNRYYSGYLLKQRINRKSIKLCQKLVMNEVEITEKLCGYVL